MLDKNSPIYRVLIVGCGNIAGGFDESRSLDLLPLSHAGAYVKHGRFKITACIDSNVDQLNRFSQYWNVSLVAHDFSELHAKPGDFDVISICSPTSFHAGHLAESLALAPRLIFCEKPLATDVESCIRLLKACRDQGVALAVNYSRRWDSSINKLIDELSNGRWGAIRSVVGHYNKGILNNGGHMIELLLRIVGPLDVVGTTVRINDFWPDDPTISVLLTAASGRIPVYLNPANARDYAYFELELICEMGVIRMESGGQYWHVREAVSSSEYQGYKELSAAKKINGEYLGAMSGAIENIYEHLYRGAEIKCIGEDVLPVQQICEQIKLIA